MSSTRRGERSRDEILDATARLMAERGYDGTSVAAVATEVGMPKSLVFHHFRSKIRLLSAVMARGADRFFDEMREAQAQPPVGGTHEERLAWYLDRAAEALARHDDFHRLHSILMMTSDVMDPEVRETITRIRSDGRAHMHRMIASAFADLGPVRASAVADELTVFGMVGIDGSFIAQRGDGIPLTSQTAQLTKAMIAIGEAHAAAFDDEVRASHA